MYLAAVVSSKRLTLNAGDNLLHYYRFVPFKVQYFLLMLSFVMSLLTAESLYNPKYCI